MRKLALVFSFIGMVYSQFLIAQDFSNKGRDFYVAYTGHIDGTQSVMGLYLTGDQNASGTVDVGGTILPFSITAGKVTTLFIGPGGVVTNTTVYNGQADGINKGAGIHIVSDRDIVAYAHIIKSARSGATLVLPKTVLGKEYIVPSFQNVGASAGYGQITVVAVEAATTVEITPTVLDKNSSHSPGIPFTVTLDNPGDVYQLQSQSGADFSGSVVRSISTVTGGCKPIAVFASTTWSAFDCSGASGGDNLYQQLFPTKSWGKKFVTAPFINKPYDFIRVFVQTPGTVVRKTEAGVTTTLTALNSPGNFYQIKTGNPTIIEADQPVSVVQYITSQTCGGGNSDPEMTLINPVEQTLDKITLFSAHQNYVPPGQTQVTQHFINVVIPTNKKGSFVIDGGSPAGSFVDIVGSGYSYLQENVTNSSAANPVHTLKADTGFTAIVYGYGNVESYGYNAGTNVRDLYQFVTVQNQYATVNFPSACKNSPFFFSITFPYQPTQIKWEFGPTLNGIGFNDVTVTAPMYDSTWIINGKSLYRYKLPTPYIIPTPGTYPVKVIAQNPSADGCNGQQEIDFDLGVFDQPAADFSFTSSGCISDSVHFVDKTDAATRPVIKWFWKFDDLPSGAADTSRLANPAHLFMSQGTHNVLLSSVSDIGCLSDTASKPVIISQPPVAKFGISAPYCAGKVISFSDSSTIQTGTIVKWTWDFGDGSPVVNSTTNAPQTHTYSVVGTYTVTLRVENSGGCKSLLFPKQVVVAANPAANFSFGNACLPGGAMQFTNASTISDGTQSGLAYLWMFGDGSTSSIKDPVHNYTAAGPFDISLAVTSVAGCSDTMKKTATTIYPQPLAQFTVDNVESCLGGTVSFQDQSTAANSTVTQWAWNFGDGQTSAQAAPSHTYLNAGAYTVTLSVTSAIGCASTTYSLPVQINALPKADFIPSSKQCVSDPVLFTDASTPNSGTIVKWTWNFGDNSPAVVAASNAVLSHTYNTTGSYTVTLQVVTDKGCSSTITTKQITINSLPVPGFKMPDNCLNDPVSVFTDTSSIADGTAGQFTYLWNFGDANASPVNPNTSAIKNGQHKYSMAQQYTVSLTVTSNKGCSATATQSFGVNGAVPLSLFSIPNGAQLCSNDTILIRDDSKVDVGKLVKLDIYWDYTANPTNKITVNYPGAGKLYSHAYAEFFTPSTKTSTIRVVAYSGDNCLSTSDKIITLMATPAIIFPAISSLCENKPAFQLPASANNMTGGIGVFSGPGVSPSGLFSPQAAGSGTHDIIYKYTGANGCSNSKQQTISVYPLPLVSAGPDKFILSGGTVVLNGTSSILASSYLWTPARYLNNPRIARPISAPTDDISYVLTVTTANGCSDSDQVFVKVLKEPTIPNVFSPNGDGVNDTWVIQYLESYNGAAVEIFNRYGQKVFESKGYPKPWDGTYKGNPLPAGTYYYIIDPKNGRKQMAGYVDIIR